MKKKKKGQQVTKHPSPSCLHNPQRDEGENKKPKTRIYSKLLCCFLFTKS